MYKTAAVLVSLYAFLTVANPVPADVNVPITDPEWSALQEGGLQRRDAASVNQPITDSEWQALGLSPTDDGVSLTKRDKVMNCGHHVTGKGGSNGHGKWIPVAQFSDVADEFCTFDNQRKDY